MLDPQGLSAQIPTEAAAAAIIRACGQDFDRHLAIVLESPDPDGPRKARVALRRLTTGIDAFSPILRDRAARNLRHRAKDLFRLLGELRDADVLDQSDQTVAQAHQTRERVRKSLRKAKAPTFGPRLQSDSIMKHLLKSGKKARRLREAPLVQIAATALDKARSRCLKGGTDLSRLSDRKTHDLRKALKSWRYLAEFFSPCWPDETENEARRAIFQSLQDALGVLTDQALLRRWGTPSNAQAEADAQAQAQDLFCAVALQPAWWRPTAAPPAA